MIGWLSREIGRLFRLCGYPEGLGCYPVGQGRTESIMRGYRYATVAQLTKPAQGGPLNASNGGCRAPTVEAESRSLLWAYYTSFNARDIAMVTTNLERSFGRAPTGPI